MALEALLAEFNQNRNLHKNQLPAQEHHAFSIRAEELFAGVVLPAFKDIINTFRQSGFTCTHRQLVHAGLHSPEGHPYFFSVLLGTGIMQIDSCISYLRERFIISACFTHAPSRTIEFSMEEISVAKIMNIVEEFTSEFIRHLQQISPGY